MLVLPRGVHHLIDFGFGDFVAEHAADAHALLARGAVRPVLVDRAAVRIAAVGGAVVAVITRRGLLGQGVEGAVPLELGAGPDADRAALTPGLPADGP